MPPHPPRSPRTIFCFDTDDKGRKKKLTSGRFTHRENSLNAFLTSPVVLFPAIPLMMINFGIRYALLARLIRNLHDTVINEKISIDDSSGFFSQIAGMRQRLRLLAIAQTSGALTFILDLSAIISLYFSIDSFGN